jgi:Domain of unknown function (DUF4279)
MKEMLVTTIDSKATNVALASVRIREFPCEHERLTELMSLTLDERQRVLPPKNTRRRALKTSSKKKDSYWALRVVAITEPDLDQLIDSVIKWLKSKESVLFDLRSQGALLEVYTSCWFEKHLGFNLRPEAIAYLDKLGIQLSFDLSIFHAFNSKTRARH